MKKCGFSKVYVETLERNKQKSKALEREREFIDYTFKNKILDIYIYIYLLRRAIIILCDKNRGQSWF